MGTLDIDRKHDELGPLTEHFAKKIKEIAACSTPTVISKKNVFRPARPVARTVIETMLAEVLKPKSSIYHFKHIAQLYRFAQQGYSCLILMEHYSNLDFPSFMYLLCRHNQLGRTISEHIIPMAAMKLNEEHPVLSTFTDAYTHISIFPARRLDELSVVSHDHVELKKAREINLAALKTMRLLSQNGNIVLMFPSGTRYKPNDPQTKRVLRAADSFMKRFDYVLFGGIAGNTLIVNDPQDMLSDYVRRDVMVYAFSAVQKCKAFRKQVKAEAGDHADDIGQLVAERIEDELETVHSVAAGAYREICG